MIIAFIASLVGFVCSVLGMRCARVIDEESNAKRWMIIIGGICHIAAGMTGANTDSPHFAGRSRPSGTAVVIMKLLSIYRCP